MIICIDLLSGTGCGATNNDNANFCTVCGKHLRLAIRFCNPSDAIRHYSIIRLIGHGGFGAVYEAIVTLRSSVRVAIKETFFSESIQAFQAEFDILRQLQHTGLPRYFETFEEKGNGYLVMEFIQGQSLQDVLDNQQKPLPELLVQAYAIQLCDILRHLHDQPISIIHRDIKPANIRITPEGLIKLVDFGLLKQGNKATNSSRRGLTPAYAPLEQWGLSGQHTDARSDVYSLGATIYHLVTGKEPPPAIDRIATDTDTLVPLQHFQLGITKPFAAAVMKAMQVSAKDRFQNVTQFREALLDNINPVSSKQPSTVMKASSYTTPSWLISSEQFALNTNYFWLSGVLNPVLPQYQTIARTQSREMFIKDVLGVAYFFQQHDLPIFDNEVWIAGNTTQTCRLTTYRLIVTSPDEKIHVFPLEEIREYEFSDKGLKRFFFGVHSIKIAGNFGEIIWTDIQRLHFPFNNVIHFTSSLKLWKKLPTEAQKNLGKLSQQLTL